MCSREAVERKRGGRRLSEFEDCAGRGRGASDGIEGFFWDREVAVGVGVGVARPGRGMGRRDEGFGMLLVPRPAVVALPGRLSSIPTGRVWGESR